MVYISTFALNIIIAIILYIAMAIDLMANVFPYAQGNGYQTTLFFLIILAAPIMWIMYIGHLVVCMLTSILRRG